MTASAKEVSAAIEAIQKAAAGIIHQAIQAKVPHIYAGQAEGLVNDIETLVYPIAAKIAIEVTDASRAAALPSGSPAKQSVVLPFAGAKS